MTYSQMNHSDRKTIHGLLKQKFSYRWIARILNRAPSSIVRELRRNTGRNGYRWQQAQARSEQRRQQAHYTRFTDEMREIIAQAIRKRMSPEYIAGRAKVEQIPMVSRERIYQYIYEEARNGGTLYTYLPRSHRKRKRRCPRSGRRGRIKNQTSIEKRPPEVELRNETGHWEGDLIVGEGQSAFLVTLVERRTLVTLIGWVKTRRAEEVSACIISLFRSVPHYPRLSLTLDNGKEFSDHEKIARRVALNIYFARPYHSWERGTNEQTNGLIRRFHPKGTRFDRFTEKQLKRLGRFLNTTPRTCLHFLTPQEAMQTDLLLGARPSPEREEKTAPFTPLPLSPPVNPETPKPRIHFRKRFASLPDGIRHQILKPMWARSVK